MSDIIQLVITKRANGCFEYIGMTADETIYNLVVAPNEAMHYIKPCLEQLRHYEAKDRTQWQTPQVERRTPIEWRNATLPPKVPRGKMAIHENGKWHLVKKPKSKKKSVKKASAKKKR